MVDALLDPWTFYPTIALLGLVGGCGVLMVIATGVSIVFGDDPPEWMIVLGFIPFATALAAVVQAYVRTGW